MPRRCTTGTDGTQGADKDAYLAWVLSVIEEFCDRFDAEAKSLMPEKMTCGSAYTGLLRELQ